MKRIISTALSFILAFTLCQPVFAAGSTMTWTGASNEDWNVADNWTPAQVPGLGDTAVIPASTVVSVVYGTTSVTLDCSGEVSVESGEYLYLTGTSYLKDGKLSGDGDVTIMVDESELQWSGGSIEGNGTFTVDSDTTLRIVENNEKILSNPLVNNGWVRLSQGRLALHGGSQGSGTFAVSNGASLVFEQGAYTIGESGGDMIPVVNNGNLDICNTCTSACFNAGYEQNSTGVLSLDVWGLSDFNQLEITGQADLDGVLEVNLINDYVPLPGATFEIMTYGSRIGTFSSITSNVPGITFEPTYNANSLTLTVSDEAAPGENVCEIDGTGYPLDQALAVAQSGDTIRLLKDIDYDGGIVVEDKSITFDLNGYTLNVVNIAEADTIEEMSGLYVKGNAAVALEGAGEFNVTGAWFGVFAECDSGEMASATVTNATGLGRAGVVAQRSKVTVRRDVTSNGSGGFGGIFASYNAEVTVEGAVCANGEMSVGVSSDELALVTVKGGVIVNGSDSIGVEAGYDGDVAVEGNVTVSGSGSIGVSLLSVAEYPSIVTIKGVIEAEKYILFEAEDGSGEEYSLLDGSFDEEITDRIYYTKDNESFVYVSTFAGGSGTGGDPYLIAHGSQLNNISAYCYYFCDKHYKQIADIDLGGWYSLGQGWRPIGNSEVPFVGSYDGDSHTISNLFINREGENNIGLFAIIGPDAEIRNVGLIDADVTGKYYTGGLAAENYGLITNSYVTGEVSGTSDAGGLISYNEGSVTDSYFDGTVTATGEYAGGLVGYNSEEGSITGCYTDATVESEGNSIGGLAGYNLGLITDSYAISAVTGNYPVGGLTGYNDGIINNSYADGNVTGTSQVGGLIGLNLSLHPITDSYFTGTVTASDDYTGGLVGDNSGGSISNCHADATVTSTGDYVGGLAGQSPGLITSSYSTGAVTGGSYVGGLAGWSFSPPGIAGITVSYSSCAVEGEMYVGGLVGSNETNISESFATGSVTGTENDTDNTYAGGLVGYNTGPISDSYAWGAVSGQDMIGGLAGYNEAGITNCYEIGAVTGENYTGGLIGSNLPGSEIISSFWNNNTSGQDSSDGGISEGSVTMKQQVTYVNEDWDFDTIWGIDTGENDGYPFLRWQVNAEFAGGSGTMENPYLISTENHLNNVRNYLDKHFRQTVDLDLSGYRSGSGWEPIGTSADPFTGVFDGDGHTIDNLFIEQDGVWNNRIPAGLFGNTGAEAEIRDLTLEDTNVTGCYYVGSLVGNNSGNITNVSGSGSVTGEWDTGGLAGLNNGSITGSVFSGDVTGADMVEYGDWTGGLVGYNLGAITDCWAYATVASVGDNAGGLVGENLTGGIITESCSAGTVTASDYSGGLAGANSGEITACYSLCTVNGDSDVGGLAGGNSGPIADSFAAGIVEGAYEVGGLTGSSTGAAVTGCYWDTETSGQSTSAGGTGKTMAEMKQPATFENWDFIAVWDINAGFNDGYPFLRWQDDVPPVLSETGAGSVTDTTAAFNFTSDKSGIYYYLVYEAAEDAPDADAIKAQGEAAAKGSGAAAAAANAAQATGLTASTAYKAYIIVEYAEENISNVAVISFTTMEATSAVPAAPQNFTATPGDGQVALSWTAPASDGGSVIIRYEVSSDNGSTWVTTATNTSHTFISLTNGTEYTFKVRAVNSVGNGAEASATATPTVAPTGPDVTPANLNITAGGTETFTISLGQSGNEADSATVTSNDTSIATVNPAYVTTSGQVVTVTGVSAGNTTVTISFIGGSYTGGDKTVSVTVADHVYDVNFYSNGSLYASKTVISGSALGTNWPGNPTRSGYSFGGWFSGQNGAGTRYTSSTIINADVDLYAKWTYNGGGSSGDGGSNTPATPAYKADIKAENGTETTLPVTVDKYAGTASVDAGSQGLDQGRTNITIPSIPDVDTYSVGIPVPDLSTSDGQGTLTVNTDAGNVTVPSNMLTGVSGISGSKAEIAIGQGDKDNLPDTVKAAIGDRPLVQLSLSIDGKQIDWSNPDAPVTVSISYTPTAAELANPESIVVWYIDGSGNVVTIPNGHYDPATGMVTFDTTHFSDYAVAYNKASFNDVTAGAWYHKAVSFIAARGITGGTGNGNYSPNAKLARGEFIIMLMKAYGIEADVNPTNNFSDAGSTYYTGYLAAAKRLGITAGVGSNMFAPEKEITRQEMLTLLYNALKVIGQLPQGDSDKTLSDFSDAGQIDSWAKEAMTLLVKTGTIGSNAGKLNPTSTTTRAEMAQVLYNLLKK